MDENEDDEENDLNGDGGVRRTRQQNASTRTIWNTTLEDSDSYAPRATIILPGRFESTV